MTDGGRSPRWKPIIVAALAAMLIAALGATVTDLGPWYQTLVQPWWKPPDILFGPAWTLIFALTAAAGVYAWTNAPSRVARDAIIALYAANGFLNVLWSLLFFRLKRPDWALTEVIFLWASIIVLIVISGRYSSRAAWLLVPYLLWVTFAGVLNWAVVDLNGPFRPR